MKLPQDAEWWCMTCISRFQKSAYIYILIKGIGQTNVQCRSCLAIPIMASTRNLCIMTTHPCMTCRYTVMLHEHALDCSRLLAHRLPSLVYTTQQAACLQWLNVCRGNIYSCCHIRNTCTVGNAGSVPILPISLCSGVKKCVPRI